MLENNYQPDGWLGFIIGANFWIDFTEDKKVADALAKLVKELGSRVYVAREKKESVVQAIDAGKCSNI